MVCRLSLAAGQQRSSQGPVANRPLMFTVSLVWLARQEVEVGLRLAKPPAGMFVFLLFHCELCRQLKFTMDTSLKSEVRHV